MNNKQLATPLCNCVARFTSTGHKRPDGGLVLYEDYYKLQAQAEKLAVALERCEIYPDGYTNMSVKTALAEWEKFNENK